MAPNPRVTAAFSAMANIGIHESKVKPVLKKLLKLYDKNWELIEEESYRALADAIFEEEENKVYFGIILLIQYPHNGSFLYVTNLLLDMV